MPGSSGRSPAPPGNRTSTHALRSRVAGSRPARSQAPSIVRRSRANPSGVFANRSYHVFHTSTWGSVAARTRGPVEPTISVGRPTGFGSRIASLVECHLPVNETRSPSSKRRTISKDSSNRDARWSYGMPKASNSVRFHPAPIPRINRPPLTSSTVAAILASTAGGWKLRQATRGPNRTRWVTVASAASIVHASHGPRSGRPSPR